MNAFWTEDDASARDAFATVGATIEASHPLRAVRRWIVARRCFIAGGTCADAGFALGGQTVQRLVARPVPHDSCRVEETEKQRWKM